MDLSLPPGARTRWEGFLEVVALAACDVAAAYAESLAQSGVVAGYQGNAVGWVRARPASLRWVSASTVSEASRRISRGCSPSSSWLEAELAVTARR